MSGDFLNDRRRAAEEAFFAKQNEALITKLRSSHPADTGAASLSAASGIQDTAVLDRLVDLQVGREGAAALSLIPLVAVAWADGELEWNEREALLRAAEQAGVARDTSAFALFDGWLANQPPTTLLDRWKNYVGALWPGLDDAARVSLRGEILARSRSVAEAAGGFLGFGKVSAAEEEVLVEIERALRA